MHLGFVHTSYSPFPTMLESAPPTLSTRKIKTLCESKGFIEYHFAFVFECKQWVITCHFLALLPSFALGSLTGVEPNLVFLAGRIIHGHILEPVLSHPRRPFYSRMPPRIGFAKLFGCTAIALLVNSFLLLPLDIFFLYFIAFDPFIKL